jgi:Family of unknown function (DUF5996)
VTANATRQDLPELPLSGWGPTKVTLHRWVQIVGKVRMASSAPRNHWWHAALYVDVRGLTTRRLHAESGTAFRIDFDFVDHRLVVATDRGDVESFPLEDGLSVAAFDEALHATLGRLGVDVAIREVPFDLSPATPFTEDTEHASYDPDAVERFRRILAWADGVLEEFAGWYCGKSSPVHFFWHGFDLAHTRFGPRAAVRPGADRVTVEAYSHEVVSFGFWAGDDDTPEPSFYAYAAPEPEGLRERALRPDDAGWQERPGGSLALLPYEAVRTAADPRLSLLAFFESVYRAGAGGLGWDVGELTSSWCPSPRDLDALLASEQREGTGYPRP